MTPQIQEKTRHSFWRDLTGQSERWVLTLVLAVVIGRLSLVAVGVAILLVVAANRDPDGVMDQYSGLTDVLTAEWVFAALVFAPLIESLAIRLVVWLLGSRVGWKWPVWATALTCALLAIPLHGLGPLSLAVAPFFALMAAIQHHWMNRGRGWAGFWLITAIHLAANALALLAMALLGLGAR
ncbi:MAG: hypothetical protein Q8K90_07965 [Brevundimonas sp.]|nr:hypothetical protein [Brevundimonas sp.]